VKAKIEVILSGISDLAWAGAALMLSFLVIYLLDKNPNEEMFLLPEWSLFALFTLMNTLKKQEEIVKHQENSKVIWNAASNIFNLCNVICVFLFVLSLIASRKYLPISNVQSEIIQWSNTCVFFMACFLYVSACYQEHKFMPSQD